MSSHNIVKNVNIERDSFYIFPESACAVHTFIDEPNKIVILKQYRPLHRLATLELPGGRIEMGESPEAAAVRELKEEAGIIAEVTQYILKLDMDFSASKHCTHLVRTHSRMPKTIREGVNLIDIFDAWLAVSKGDISHAPTVSAILLLMAGKYKQ